MPATSSTQASSQSRAWIDLPATLRRYYHSLYVAYTDDTFTVSTMRTKSNLYWQLFLTLGALLSRLCVQTKYERPAEEVHLGITGTSSAPRVGCPLVTHWVFGR